MSPQYPQESSECSRPLRRWEGWHIDHCSFGTAGTSPEKGVGVEFPAFVFQDLQWNSLDKARLYTFVEIFWVVVSKNSYFHPYLGK